MCQIDTTRNPWFQQAPTQKVGFLNDLSKDWAYIVQELFVCGIKYARPIHFLFLQSAKPETRLDKMRRLGCINFIECVTFCTFFCRVPHTSMEINVNRNELNLEILKLSRERNGPHNLRCCTLGGGTSSKPSCLCKPAYRIRSKLNLVYTMTKISTCLSLLNAKLNVKKDTV